jgi:hypothetical protein
MNVHHIYRLFYEQYEVIYENNCLSTEVNKGNANKNT